MKRLGKFIRAIFQPSTVYPRRQERDQTPEPNIPALISERVFRSGLTNGRTSDIEFYQLAHARGQLNGRDVRKMGRRLSPSEKAALGIKYRGVLTAEFVQTLNVEGVNNPEDAAWKIASPASAACSNAKELAQLTAQGLYAQFLASGMAAGPCSCAAILNGQRLPPTEAPIPPLPACPHPDQCACFFRAALSLTGEF